MYARRWFAASFIALMVAAPPASAQVVMSELPLLPGAWASSASAINSSGQISGGMNFLTAPTVRGVIWTAGVPVELPRLCETCNSGASDINDAGDVAGLVLTPDGIAHAGLWINGTATALPLLPGDTFAFATSINNSRIVAGYARTADGLFRPMRWVNGVAEDLGVFSVDMPTGAALAINDAGEIVGSMRTVDGSRERPFVWRNGAMLQLEMPPSGSCELGAALGNNENGLIVGYVFVDCRQTAAVWENGVLRILQPLPEMPMFPAPQGGGSALDVNELGDAVGYGNPPFGPATLWRDGQAIDLESLQPMTQPTTIAYDINDTGVVVGIRRLPGTSRAVVWTTTPPNTAPTLTVPGNITVNASSPSGAVVTFTASADDEEDGAFLPVCSPASGSQFAIGTTTVSCTATDSGGVDATGSFTVTVLGAPAQIDDMFQTLGAGGAGSSLENKLTAVLESLGGSSAKGVANACALLQAFIHEVSAQAGKKLTQSQAASLIESAQRIRAIVGC